ncbi:hypothetical protein CEXT_353881 [Caerostris extrusa]|uniref:Ig-like domain-containing protein n=1 Tax=Caerostris extrusa TaxID=172846 RepID=A0AAV4X1H9_CAEEX|nr:hypothetical protein CEXT_353881 [Caerostris extrusa]
MVNKPMPCHAHYASQELKQSSQTANSPFATNTPPVWVIKPSDQSALEGISVTFDCQAEGQPRPVVRWKFGKDRGFLLNVPRKKRPCRVLKPFDEVGTNPV